MGSCYFPYKLSYITFGRPEVKFVQSGFNQRKREERSFAPQNILKRRWKSAPFFLVPMMPFVSRRDRESQASHGNGAHLVICFFGSSGHTQDGGDFFIPSQNSRSAWHAKVTFSHQISWFSSFGKGNTNIRNTQGKCPSRFGHDAPDKWCDACRKYNTLKKKMHREFGAKIMQFNVTLNEWHGN